MKKYIIIKVTVKDPETGNVDEFEVDSQWSQETEMFCERVVKQLENMRP